MLAKDDEYIDECKCVLRKDEGGNNLIDSQKCELHNKELGLREAKDLMKRFGVGGFRHLKNE